MKPMLAAVMICCLCAPCFADFQYNETSKITGGAASGAMKFAGVFSKDARQAAQGTNSTISLKGNKMRHEDSLGMAEIIDLDGRRIIHIDSKKKTYSIMTFDEMRAQMEEARRKAAEQQAKHNKNQGQVKITPKIKIEPGSGTRQILNYTAKEMKLRVDMLMESDDPQAKGQNANMWVNSDSFVAPVKGYDELKRFNQRLAKELDWVPGAVFGANPQIAPAMVEYRKNAATLNGMPLLSMISVGMEGQGGQQQASRDDQKSSSNSSSSSGNPITQGIGGIFGRKKKNKDEAAQQDNSSGKPGATASPAPNSAPGNSLLDTTVEVTSISTNPVDASLFEIPQGYKQVPAK